VSAAGACAERTFGDRLVVDGNGSGLGVTLAEDGVRGVRCALP
jgi:hypothetical protein